MHYVGKEETEVEVVKIEKQALHTIQFTDEEFAVISGLCGLVSGKGKARNICEKFFNLGQLEFVHNHRNSSKYFGYVNIHGLI